MKYEKFFLNAKNSLKYRSRSAIIMLTITANFSLSLHRIYIMRDKWTRNRDKEHFHFPWKGVASAEKEKEEEEEELALSNLCHAKYIL